MNQLTNYITSLFIFDPLFFADKPNLIVHKPQPYVEMIIPGISIFSYRHRLQYKLLPPPGGLVGAE